MSRRIRTQQEADELNALGYYDARTGKPIVFVVSTDEHVWAEFCQLWPRVAEWAVVVRDMAVDALRHSACSLAYLAEGDVETAKMHADEASRIASDLPGNWRR